MKKLLAIAAIATVLTGCAGVGDYVGGEDRCYTTAHNGCVIMVKSGVLTGAGSDTYDIMNDGKVYLNRNATASFIDHAFDGVKYNHESI